MSERDEPASDIESEGTDNEPEATSESESDDDGGGGERRYTQAELDRIIADRLARDRRSQAAKRARKTRGKEPKSEDDNAESPATDDGSWRDEFYDAIDEYKLSRGQRRRIREAFRRERPDDPDAWVADWAEDFGIERIGETATETRGEKPREPEPKPTEPSKSDRGAPNAPTDYDSMIDPNLLTADDIRRMEAKYGDREAHRKIRQMVERHYKGRKVS